MTALTLGSAARRSLYKFPQVYDLAFSNRNFEEEVGQMLCWYTDYTSGATAQHAIEFASGPSRHSMALSKRGVRATAVDRSAEMCRYANRLAEKRNINLHVDQADMVNYRTSHRYDLAHTMLDSITHIHKEQELAEHFNTVASMLTSNGIYVLETPNRTRDREVVDWVVSNESETVAVNYQQPVRPGATCSVVDESILKFRWSNEKSAHHFEYCHVSRRWLPSEIRRCATTTGVLRVVGEFGAFDSEIGAASTDALRYIAVLQRAE